MERVRFGIGKLDQMLGGGLLPGTLTVVYGATGIGKTHLGLTFAVTGERYEGVRRVVVDGVDPSEAPHESVQLYTFDELYRKIIHQDGEVLGMEVLIPVWRHRDFIQEKRYDHREVATLLLVTTQETLLDDLIARKIGEGDIGASANTILVMGRRMGQGEVGRALYVAKHRGSACSAEIAEYTITDQGLVFP